MWRASLVLALVLALASRARADDDTAALRSYIVEQIAAQAEVVDRARTTVRSKLAALDALRTRRLAAIARIVDARDASMSAARARAAAKLLAERDLAERTLLAAELAELDETAARIAADARRAPELPLPPPLGALASGTIERHFGTYEHPRSGATLSRRGIEIEVEAGRSSIAAPADGVVKYAGELRGLDHGVILDHGTFTTVIGKLGEITVPVGAKLAKGDRVGRTARHRVYLEVRVKLGPGGLPVDPEPLLARSR